MEAALAAWGFAAAACPPDNSGRAAQVREALARPAEGRPLLSRGAPRHPASQLAYPPGVGLVWATFV